MVGCLTITFVASLLVCCFYISCSLLYTFAVCQLFYYSIEIFEFIWFGKRIVLICFVDSVITSTTKTSRFTFCITFYPCELVFSYFNARPICMLCCFDVRAFFTIFD